MLIDFSPTPTARRRADLAGRLKRLDAMRDSVEKATDALAGLASKPSFTHVLIRRSFAYQVDAPPGDWSDRKLPAPELRPPAAQLISPRGASLRFYLTALFEAQSQGRAGTRPTNRRPLKSAGADISWMDLLASGAQRSRPGQKTYTTTTEKKARQLSNTLDKLVAADLVALLNPDLRGLKKYEGFRLQHEAGSRRSGPNIDYTLPRATDSSVFGLPVTLFTKGWIHVLEDSELLFVLMLACHAAKTPPEGLRIDSTTRLLHHGMGRDGYEAHMMLSRLKLASVTPDAWRRDDGRVEGYNEGTKPLPHALKLLPEGFDADAMTTIVEDIHYQVGR